jgi:amidase
LEDHHRPLHPTMLRTMKDAESKLRAAGHIIVPLNDLEIYEAGILSWSFFFLDPQKTPVKRVAESGEPWVKSISTVLPPEVHLSNDLDRLWDMNVERRKVLKRFHDIMVTNKLDSIILPPYQATAVPHDTYGFPMYTVLANLLDWPAGVIPHLEANAVADKPYLRENVVYNPPCMSFVSLIEACTDLIWDNPGNVETAPSGIQLMGLPMKDEELLKIMAVIDNTLKK